MPNGYRAWLGHGHNCCVWPPVRVGLGRAFVAGGPGGVAAGLGVDGVVAVGLLVDGVVAVVDAVVVSAAEQDAVGDVGGAAVGPVLDVVGIAPAGRGVAAGPDAVPVAGDDGAGLGG